MTPEQLNYIREWARGGNEPRITDDIADILPDALEALYEDSAGNSRLCDWSRLSPIGLLIARMADALEQGRAVLTDHCQVDYGQHCNYCGKPWGAHREDCAMMVFLCACGGILGNDAGVGLAV